MARGDPSCAALAARAQMISPEPRTKPVHTRPIRHGARFGRLVAEARAARQLTNRQPRRHAARPPPAPPPGAPRGPRPRGSAGARVNSCPTSPALDAHDAALRLSGRARTAAPASQHVHARRAPEPPTPPLPTPRRRPPPPACPLLLKHARSASLSSSLFSST